MFKRLFWLTTGMAIGFGTSFWVYRLVRQTLERYRPEHIADTVSQSLRGLRDDLRAALAEGRAGMRQAGGELRAELGPR